MSRIKKMSPLLLVSDLKHSIEFYTKKLGFDVDFLYEDFYAGIIKDGYSIHLKINETFIKNRENSRSKEDIDITFSIDDIEELYEDLLNRSVDITQLLRTMPYGKEFYVADPDQNIIAFLEEA